MEVYNENNVNRKYYLIHLLIIFFFLLFSRLFALNLLPVALVHDETVYTIQAQSFVVQGKTLDQKQSWFSFQPVNPMYAELPPLVIAPGFLMTSNNLLASHLMPAVLGIFFPFIFAWLIYGIWRNKELALISCYIAAFNPFFWQFSRLSYDPFFSVFFYLLGAAVLVNNRGWNKLVSLPFFILGFFQYQGFKLVLIPWVIGILILKYSENEPHINLSWTNIKKSFFAKSQLPLWLTLFSVTLIPIFYGLFLFPQENLNNRIKFNIFSNEAISAQVNNDRRISLDSPLNSFFINKPLKLTEFIATRLARSFNPEMLFLKGEPVSNFAVTTHGIFYLFDLVLIFGGFCFLLTRQKKWLTTFTLLVMIVMMALPSVVNTMSEWYLTRMQLSYLLLLFFISWGGYKISQLRKIKWFFMIIYLGGVAFFGYQYFFRYPITSADRANISERVIAKYISLVQNKDPQQPITIHTIAPEFLFSNYLLYTNKLNKNTADEIASQLNLNKNKATLRFSLDKVVFTNNCQQEDADSIEIYDSLYSVCNQQEIREFFLKRPQESQKKNLSIPLVIDSGERYRIIQDKLCNKYNLNSYIRITSLKQFQIDNMLAQEFCTTWLTDINNI